MPAQKGGIDQALIRDLAQLLDETGLTEIEIEQNGLRLRVARQGVAVHAAAPSATMPVPVPAAPIPSADPAARPGVVLSPMVGTAYRSAEPGAKPYVDIGSTVKAGETVLIIEAMKTMNQIPAPHGGTVVQILVEDGQPVEYGEPLMIIE